jgi:hypothetical protein
MEKIRIKNKKAQVGSTLTWFVGFLVIFFIMLLFLAGTTLLAAQKESGKKEPEKYDSKVLDLNRNLIHFLKESHPEGTNYEILSEVDSWDNKDEGIKRFEAEAQKFMKENNLTVTGKGFFSLDQERTWLRVYKTGAKINDNSENSLYNLRYGYISDGDCSPQNGKEAILITLFIFPDKEIVLCIDQGGR